jgi:acrylyl-CoA reductase (NADPH)
MKGSDLPTTVLPFILRGVSLAGINSVDAPVGLRREAWERLAADLDLGLLDELTTEIALADVVDHGPRIVAGSVRGRVVVDVRR